MPLEFTDRGIYCPKSDVYIDPWKPVARALITHGHADHRVEYKGEVWVVSGDYKLENDGISEPFEPVKCHSFISESTFGLPIYSWNV